MPYGCSHPSDSVRGGVHNNGSPIEDYHVMLCSNTDGKGRFSVRVFLWRQDAVTILPIQGLGGALVLARKCKSTNRSAIGKSVSSERTAVRAYRICTSISWAERNWPGLPADQAPAQ